MDQQTTAVIDDSPKLDQYLLDSIAAVVTSSSTSVSSTIGFQNFGGNGGSGQSLQNTNEPEMPQLMSILNELLDGQDLTTLARNGDNMQDMVDQEENYEDDSPRKDDPEELTRLLVQQRLEEINREEQQLQRKMDFLIRRLYKLVARSTGLHASEEIGGFLEHVVRYSKKKDLKEMQSSSIGSKFPCLTANLQGTSPSSFTNEPPNNLLSSPSTSQEKSQYQKLTNSFDVIEAEDFEAIKPVPISEMKSFLRRIENLSTMQCTMLNKRAHALKYFAEPSPNSINLLAQLESNLSHSTVERFEDGNLEQLDQVSGLLMSEMRLIEKQIDSDATASSSGGESADEMIVFSNHHQEPLSM